MDNMQASKRATKVIGVKSPYPRDVIVIKVNQTQLEYV